MAVSLDMIEGKLAELFSNIKLVEKALLGIEGSYVEHLTILALGLLAIIPVFVPKKRRQFWRHLNQIFGIGIFLFVVFTCLGVFGMIRNFHRGLSEIGRENRDINLGMHTHKKISISNTNDKDTKELKSKRP